MNMKKRLTAAAASVLLVSMMLAGCSIRDPQDVRSVEWYEENESKRAEVLAECMANPETADQTPDCVNARRAENNVKSATS